MSISDKIQALETSRQAIATAITQKGGTVAQGDGFSQFATEISNLPSGGSDSTLRDLIEGDITSITIPSGTNQIKSGVFSNCSSLQDVTIPDSVTTIGSQAFAGCRSFVSVNIPNSVRTIQTEAFAQLGSSLKHIRIGSGVTSMGTKAFYSNTMLNDIVCFATTPPTLNGTQFTLAFYNTGTCPIYVPASSVAAYKADSQWSYLSSRIVAIEDAILFTPTNGDPAISVKNYELATANYVQSTDVPSTIKNGAGSLEIGGGVTRIGTFAFQSGSSLTSVTIPSTITRIDNAAFDGCSSLTSITVNAATPPTLYAAAFDNTNNCPIYVPDSSVDTYKAASEWSTYASRIQGMPVFEKITDVSQITSGKYLAVDTNRGFALDASLVKALVDGTTPTINSNPNVTSVTISNDAIIADTNTMNAAFDYDSTTGYLTWTDGTTNTVYYLQQGNKADFTTTPTTADTTKTVTPVETASGSGIFSFNTDGTTRTFGHHTSDDRIAWYVQTSTDYYTNFALFKLA